MHVDARASQIFKNIKKGNDRRAIQMILVVAISDGGDAILEDVVMLAVASRLVVEAREIVSAAIAEGGEDVKPVLEAVAGALFTELQIQGTWSVSFSSALPRMQCTIVKLLLYMEVAGCPEMLKYSRIVSV